MAFCEWAQDLLVFSACRDRSLGEYFITIHTRTRKRKNLPYSYQQQFVMGIGNTRSQADFDKHS